MKLNIDDRQPNTGRYLDENDRARNIIEGVTGAVKDINSDHAAIHLELGYCMSLYHASLAAGAKKIYRVVGPETLFAHIKSIKVSAQGAPLMVKLITEPTITTPGGEIAGCIRNLNHNSEKLNQLHVFDGSVAYTGGSVWCPVIVHGDTGGVGGNKIAASGQFSESDFLEYVTKNDAEEYILEIENLNAPGGDPAVHILTRMFFYEEPYGVTKSNSY
jgi:hypothetical protein